MEPRSRRADRHARRLHGVAARPPLLAAAAPAAAAPRDRRAADRRTADRVTAVRRARRAQARARARSSWPSAYFGRGQMTTALDEVKLAIAADPTFGEAYNLRGLIYAQPGRRPRWPRRASGARCSSTRATPTRCTTTAGSCASRSATAKPNALFAQALAHAAVPRRRRARCWRRASARRAPASCAEAEAHADARLRARSRQPGHRRQPGRGAVPARRVRARALLHPPRQRHAATSSNAQTLWLAARIENQLGNRQRRAATSARQLRNRFPAVARSGGVRRGARSMSDGGRRQRRRARSAGALLREAREAQGLHIAALAASIKVAAAKLEALEADRFDELPDADLRARAGADRLPRAEDRRRRRCWRCCRAPARHRLEHVGERHQRAVPRPAGPARAPSDWTAWPRQPVFWRSLLLLVAAAARRTCCRSGWLAEPAAVAGAGDRAEPAAVAPRPAAIAARRRRAPAAARRAGAGAAGRAGAAARPRRRRSRPRRPRRRAAAAAAPAAAAPAGVLQLRASGAVVGRGQRRARRRCCCRASLAARRDGRRSTARCRCA